MRESLFLSVISLTEKSDGRPTLLLIALISNDLLQRYKNIVQERRVIINLIATKENFV